MGITIRTLSKFRGLRLAFGGRWRYSFLLNDGIAFVLILASVGSCSIRQPQGEGGTSEPPAVTTRAGGDRVSLEVEVIRQGAKSELRINGTGWPEDAVLVVNIRSQGELSMTSDQLWWGEPLDDAVLVRSVKSGDHATLMLDLDKLLAQGNRPKEVSIFVADSLFATHFTRTGPISVDQKEKKRLTSDSFGSQFTELQQFHDGASTQYFTGVINNHFPSDEKNYWRLTYYFRQDVIVMAKIPLSDH